MTELKRYGLVQAFVEHIECVGEIPALSINCDDGVDNDGEGGVEVALCGRSVELATHGWLI